MSTDLELPQDLQEILVPTIKITSSQSSDVTFDDTTIAIQTQNCSIFHHEDECQTPKSPQHMIPKILNCPPAPKKPRRVASCKRKLCELQFFEIVSREEVESLFRSGFGVVELNSRGATKRRFVV